MTYDTLATISITLLEVTLILIVVAIVVIVKYRKLKNLTPKNTAPPLTKTTLVSYFSKLVQQNEKKLSTLDDTKDSDVKFSLSTRISSLKSEINILKSTNKEKGEKNYWEFVVDEFSKIAEKDVGVKEEFYQSRISNLEGFKNLFFDAEKKLTKAQITIEELRAILDEKPEDNIPEIIEKVNFLESENNKLQEQLIAANVELEKAMPEILDENKTAKKNEMASLQEENDFLVTQIQHLLKQEVETSTEMLKTINSLEDRIDEKTAECERLKSTISGK